MARQKTKNKYVTLKLPETTVAMIDFLQEQEGFTSRTDVLKHIVRNAKEEHMRKYHDETQLDRGQ